MSHSFHQAEDASLCIIAIGEHALLTTCTILLQPFKLTKEQTKREAKNRKKQRKVGVDETR
jgi:translation initiation factor IF-3